MDQITGIQSDVRGNFNANRGDNSVFGSGNVIGETRTHHQITNISVINQEGPSRAKDGEPKETSRPYWVVPYSRNTTFTGRNAIIELVKGYCKNKDHNRVALLGLGGSGKTQIALEYVYQSAQESGCDVFWVNGSGVVKFGQGFRTIAQEVQIPRARAETNEEGFLRSMKAWFEGPDSGDWILVIDNADNEDDFLSNDSQISKFVPQGKKGTVIFTTRSRQVASRQCCKGIEVGKMTMEEARELFSKCFHNWDSLEEEERKFVPMILDLLVHLPLAVVGAVSFMNETQTPPSIYCSIFQDNDKGRKQLLMRRLCDIRREADVTENILSTYFINFDRIIEQMPAAAELLWLISCFDCHKIPEVLLSQCGLGGVDDPMTFREVIGKLLGFSLVTGVKRGGKQFYELHRLVQLSVHAYLSTEELDRWKATALGVVSRLFPRDETEWRYGGSAAAYIPHALAVTKDSTDSIAETLGFSMGKYFLDTGSYGEAEAQVRQCIALRNPDTKRHCDGEYWSRVLLLAAVTRLQGRLMEAEEMLRKEHSDIEKALGPDHAQTLACVNELAKVLGNLGRYGESESMFRVALEGREKALGLDHPDTLKSVRNLGGVLRDLGCYHKSEMMIRRALEGSEKVLGLDHPDTLRNVGNLASVLQALGRYDESERMFRRVLESNEKVLGPDHPDYLGSVNNVALILQALGRYRESERMFRRALESKEKVLGPDHPDTLTSVHNLASVLQDLRMYTESERLSRRALEWREKILGADHPYTLASVNDRASILQALGMYDESERMFRRASEFNEKVLGPDHPDTLTSVHNLASVLQDLRMYAESESLSRRALEGRENVLGADHPYTLTSVYNLAGVLEDQGKYDESEEMWRHALEAQETALGPEHDEVYKILECLASLYEKQRKYSQAQEAYERACTGFSKTLGELHPITLECIRRLTKLRETKSAAVKTSAIDTEVVVNDINNRRSLHDCLRKLRWLRRRRGLRGGKPRKRL